MPVLVYIDQSEGQVKKASLEAICYAAAIARLSNDTVEGICLGQVKDDLSSLGKYGLSRIHQSVQPAFDHFDARLFTRAIAELVEKTGSKLVIFSHNPDGRALAPRLSARLKAGLVTGAVSLPDLSNGFVVRKSVFSGKAYADIALETDTRIISINPNSYQVQAGEGTAEVLPFEARVDEPQVSVREVHKLSNEIPLSEAEIVVSGGRGLKGPENWGMVEELARLLGAATACSRPVADAGWRPHHEHVGQTGLAIAPNLYFAIGISGAIQHLAGVNRSKVIVVINKDPEAPFFKAADYGIVGDAFEVMPGIIDAVKKLKGQA